MRQIIFIILLLLEIGCSNKNSSKCVEGNCENGKGRLEWKDGGYMEGQWVNGKLTGLGIEYFGKTSEFYGDTYKGEFKENVYHGHGIYYDKSEDNTYEGQWNNGKSNGKGKLTSGSKAKFPGMWYDGEWKNGQMHGNGIKFWGSTGEHAKNKYVGQWRYDKMEGKGTYYWPDGGYYEGPWMNGEQQGNGVYVFGNGEVFKGYWDKGYCEALAKKMGLE
jgi:hypothetical protein